jgi:hypothetical protein
MDTMGCGVCKSPGHNQSLAGEDLAAFWLAKGVTGGAPEGMEVRSVVRCWKRINMPNRDECGCETAWVRNAPNEAWRPIVRIPSTFVAGVSN